MSAKRTDSSFYNSSASTSIVGEAGQSSTNAAHTILQSVDGRLENSHIDLE